MMTSIAAERMVVKKESIARLYGWEVGDAGGGMTEGDGGDRQ